MLQNKQLIGAHQWKDPKILGAAREDGPCCCCQRLLLPRGDLATTAKPLKSSVTMKDASGWMEGVEKSQHPSLKIEMSVNNPVYLICRREASSPLSDVRDVM